MAKQKALTFNRLVDYLVLLETADLAHENGVTQLLDHARSLIRTNPTSKPLTTIQTNFQITRYFFSANVTI